MQIKNRPYSSREPTAYRITVNTSSFQASNSSLKERNHKEYVPKYWKRFKMDQKHIVPSSEDRLSELRTKQIDRIIDMQKIRSLLYDKKRKVDDKYFEYDQKNPNQHSNVYQANFLARINEIAIERNIRPEDEGFDEFS